MHLRFQRMLPCRPTVAWSLANDPRRMNLWSLARVELVSRGDGRHPAGVGSLRRVSIPGGFRPLELDEVVVAADPPHRFAYRAIPGAPVKSHVGRLTFEEAGPRTRLTWEIDIEPQYRLLGSFIRRALVSPLKRSLDRLERAAAAADDGLDLPPDRDLDETSMLPALYETAEECLDEQREFADALGLTDAPERWFTRVYQHVTELQLEACRAGTFEHTAWVLRLIAAFHRYYVMNLRAWLRRDLAAVEAHWASAFRAMEGATRHYPAPLDRLGYTIDKGMQAHIEEDLPRALAQVWARHYAHRCDYVRLRGDYLAMGPIFQQAASRLLDAFPRRDMPVRLRLLFAFTTRSFRNRRVARDHYDVARERRKAFERGERIGHMIAAEGQAVRAAP